LSDGVHPAGRPADDWPHTTRFLPWLIAAFLVMLWLIPFDAIDLRVNLPVDSKLDRVLLAALVVLWLATLAAGGRWAPTPRRSMLNRAVLVFVAIAVLSILLNLDRIELLGEREVAVKKLLLLLSYVAFFFVVSSAVRVSELRNFGKLFLTLAALAAIGTLLEYRVGINVFYDWSAALLPDFFQVATDKVDPAFERANVTGPSGHGLAVATMLAIALPFALAWGMEARTSRERLFYYCVAALVFAGGIATVRKTAAIVPMAAIATLVVFRPRRMIRLAPLGLVLLVFVQAAAPGAAGAIKSQLESLDSRQSTKGRTADYEAVVPDLRTHLIIGRGYGTYEHDKYRILDNEYLALMISVGIIGFAAFLAMMLGVVAVAARPIRSGDPVRGPPALGAAGAAMAFAAASGLYDVLAFPQAPYLFFFIAAMAVVAAAPAPHVASVQATSRLDEAREAHARLGPQLAG
jgi:hypothetical protein